MRDSNQFILETERFILRPYCKEDAKLVYPVVGRKEIAATTLMIPYPYPRQHVDWWIRYTNDNRKRGIAFEFGIFLKENPLVYIGNCGLITISQEHKNAELAYFIDPDYWNQGCGTEACKRVLDFGFRTLLLQRIAGRCMSRNIGSRRVMEKSGLRYEGTSRREIYKWGEFEDVARFAILRSEWYV